MENIDYNKHPPTFGSAIASPLIPKESNERYDNKLMMRSRSGLFKESFMKDSSQDNSSFLTKDKEMESLKLLAGLLNSQDDWKGVPEIIMWSIKAIYDSCQNMHLMQGLSKRELERVISEKASKSELSSCVHVKANICDVSVIISEIAGQMETKIDEETLNNAVSDKATYEDLQQLDDKKLDLKDFQDFLNSLDIESVISKVNEKIDRTEINELLNTKIDRETITNAMDKKATKTEIYDAKSELEERISNLETSFKTKLEKILEAQDHFIKLVESGELVGKDRITKNNPIIEDIRRNLDSKLDRRELDTYNFEQLSNLNKIKDDMQTVVHKLSSNIDSYKNS